MNISSTIDETTARLTKAEIRKLQGGRDVATMIAHFFKDDEQAATAAESLGGLLDRIDDESGVFTPNGQ